MPRVRAVTMDGLSLKISPLTYDEVDVYISEGKAMLEKVPPATQEEWAMRTINTVVTALNKAVNGSGEKQWDAKRLTSELDMVMINKIYEDFMDMSGLRTGPREKATGEALATSTLQ